MAPCALKFLHARGHCTVKLLYHCPTMQLFVQVLYRDLHLEHPLQISARMIQTFSVRKLSITYQWPVWQECGHSQGLEWLLPPASFQELALWEAQPRFPLELEKFGRLVPDQMHQVARLGFAVSRSAFQIRLQQLIQQAATSESMW